MKPRSDTIHKPGSPKGGARTAETNAVHEPGPIAADEDAPVSNLQSRARIGKIARLPLAVKDELNDRLADGEQGDSILRWLNGHPDVIEVLKKSFGGRPILKQNLSAWRRGGHEDWIRHGEALRFMARMSREAHELSLTSRQDSLNETAAQLLAVRVASVVHATRDIKDWSKPRHLDQLLSMCAAVAALRRGDHAAERLRLEKMMLEVKQTEQRLRAEEVMKRNRDDLLDYWARASMLIRERFETEEERHAAFLAIMLGEDGEHVMASLRRMVAESTSQGQSRQVKPRKNRP